MINYQRQKKDHMNLNLYGLVFVFECDNICCLFEITI